MVRIHALKGVLLSSDIPTPPGTAFVTGATGFVGSFLVDRLLQDGWHVIALARGSDAEARVCRALQNVRGNSSTAPKSVAALRVLCGNVRDPFLGLPEATAEKLAKEVDAVWHCAANFGPGSSGDTPFNVNVTGTRHLLAFAERCNRHRRVPFYHVSTAFAADCAGGLAREDPPIAGVAGRNEYESSKREAERLVLEWNKTHAFAAQIFRPSIILGHARTGRTVGFGAYYDCVRSLCSVAKLQRSPSANGPLRVRSRPDLGINFVTIDFVIDAMCALARSPLGADSIFNIVNEEPATMGEVVTVMCRSFGLSGVVLADDGAFTHRPMTRHERMFHAMIDFERPYLEREVHFDNSRFRRVVPAHILPAPRINATLLERINRGYREHCEQQAIERRTRQRPSLNVMFPPCAVAE